MGYSYHLLFYRMNKASKIVSSAVIGYDCRRILINGKSYLVKPPTIHRLSGAAYYLSDLPVVSSFKELLDTLKDLEVACKALSFIIQGDEALADEFTHAQPQEVINGLEIAISLIDVQSFMKLSALIKSVSGLIATPVAKQ